MEQQLTVYVALIAKAAEGMDFLARGADAAIERRAAFTRWLKFEVSADCVLPSAVWETRKTDGASLMGAQEWLFIEADEGRPAVAFIADAAAAGETAQLALMARVAAWFVRSREDLAAVPWAEFEALAAEMAQKGVVLVYEGWCEQNQMPEAFSAHFDEVARCLKHKQPLVSQCGITV